MKLGDIALNMHQGINTVADKVEYQNNGIPIIQSKNITSGFLDLDDVRYLGDVDKNKYRDKYNPRKGDILLANIGTIGKSLVIKDEQDFLIAWNLFLIRINQKVCVPQFIKYYFDYLLKNNKFLSLLSGGTVKFINKKKMYDLSIPNMSLDDQQIIVNKLDKLSKVISLRNEQIHMLDNLIKSRFVELFGDLMLNPYEWPVMKISDISLLLKSGLSRKLSDEDIGLPVIRSGNIQNGQFLYDDVKYWYKDDPQGSKTEDYILEDGDILVNFINSASQIGKTTIFRDIGRECIYTTNIFRMKLAENCNEYYYNWFSMSDYYYKQLHNIIQPAVNQASFTTVNFLKLNIPLPPIELQNQFAAFVELTDKSKFV